MSVESEFRRFKDLSQSIGKRALNALYPDDIEIYIYALELVNGDGDTEDYFIFPVNPSSNNEQQSPIQNFKKTAGGITVLSTTTFSPSTIMLQGNFGRKFKFIAGSELISFSSINFKPTLNDIKPTFSKNIKTGYGCIKVMEAILEKSNTLDKKGQPYALFIYNLALGNSYLCKYLDHDFHQNLESNMIWNYTLSLKSLMRVEDIIGFDSKRSMTVALSANSAIQNTVNNIGNSIGALIPR